MDVEDVRDMFASSWFEKGMVAVVVIGERAAGYSWVWKTRGGLEASLCIDPALPPWSRHEVGHQLLRWIRRRLDAVGGRGRVSIWGGYRYGYIYTSLCNLLNTYVVKHSSTLMKFGGRIVEVEPPKNCRIVEMGEVPAEVLKSIVDVHNDAFSRYEWHTPWSVEDARRYFAKKKPKLFLALVDEEVVGYAEILPFRAVDGRTSVEVTVLAVKSKYQGRGIGKALLSKATSYLERSGMADRAFLVSVAGLESFYRKLGFIPWRESVRFIVPASSIPLI